ncbi:MAG: tRNA1(Val) (adenine(37)-N6)-methyltransferase [Alphaproteobacteria bacterium]
MTRAPANFTLGEDGLLGGRVRLRQPARGYRAAIDPVLLAAAVPAATGDSVLDVGTGVGAAALCLAQRVADCRVVGIELQRGLVRLAGENAALNGAERRVEMMTGDLTRPPPRLAVASFDHVMANPPHLDPRHVRPSPVPARATATVEATGGLADWVAFCLRMARPNGSLTFIHRADRLDDLLARLIPGAGAITVYPLWPGGANARPAKRVIVQARKGSAAPLRLLPGLTLHRPDGAYTASAEAVLRDAEAIEL